ncbi:DUF305 domain-containing protein [Polluticoccus soli]|uniref:DUF305 domain-containing protein n=1 Tax=Polluticoccus soli TaxID=3034150 RepID=UPI0023E26D3D|nr:DUF305 domain-containing protein [Flavipsychrobacter sp. JY13-12]
MAQPILDTTDHRMDGLSADTYTGAIYSMMKKMKAVQMTGDFDIDFAKTMIEHHQGAIDLSKIELNTGKNEELRAIARKIIDVQSKEVTELKNSLQGYQASGMKHGEGELKQSMTAMEQKMKDLRTTADPDSDFAIIMTMHHHESIDMAKKELTNGMSEKLKQTAKKIVDSSSREIKEFEKFAK